jgi:hypothetical protein
MVSFVSNPPGCVNLNIRLLRPDEPFQFFYYYGPYLSATPRPGIILAVEEEKALFHRSTAQEKSCLGQHLRGVTEARVTHHDGHGSTEEDAVMKKLIMSFTVLVGLMTASAGFSGINNELPPPEKLSNNFPDLARLRIKLVEREIPQAEKELALLAIFSGQAGMQFVTLFSLVIAIILFGITSILEAKELAALLGGLSGYILGRVTAERQPVTAPGTAPQPASPAPPSTSPVPVQP